MHNDNNTTNNNDLSAYNTYSNYTSSLGEDDINSNKNKNKFFIDKYNDNKKNKISKILDNKDTLLFFLIFETIYTGSF